MSNKMSEQLSAMIMDLVRQFHVAQSAPGDAPGAAVSPPFTMQHRATGFNGNAVIILMDLEKFSELVKAGILSRNTSIDPRCSEGG